MCTRCGLEHSEHERCWEAMRHKLAELQEDLTAAQATNNALAEEVCRRRDAAIAKARAILQEEGAV